MLRYAKRCAIWPGLACARTISPGLSDARRKRCVGDVVMTSTCGVAEANAIVSGSLFAAAKGGNVVAQIFWLKTRAQWRERVAPGDRTAGGDADANSPVVLVLPDNGRDPELVQAPQDVRESLERRR